MLYEKSIEILLGAKERLEEEMKKLASKRGDVKVEGVVVSAMNVHNYILDIEDAVEMLRGISESVEDERKKFEREEEFFE